jgi:hypothetical protein
MPGFVGGHHYSKAGPNRMIFVASGDTSGDALHRVMGDDYVTVFAAVAMDGTRGSVWSGSDPVDGFSKKDRDILVRLSKSGFAARQITDAELRAAVNPGQSLASEQAQP